MRIQGLVVLFFTFLVENLSCVSQVLTTSNLPIVVVNTNNVTIPNTPKIPATMGIIWNEDNSENSILDPFNEYFGQIGIERRGSSSNSFPAKSYSLETRSPLDSNYNVNIFQMPKDNDWILYAPYTDKSLIRNVLTYHLGNKLGHWSPRTQLCELILNNEYQGVYVFMEKIKINPGRVDIHENTYSDTQNNSLTGGYIFKIDKTTEGGVIIWNSPYNSIPFNAAIRYQMHDPDYNDMHPTQLDYLESIVTEWETKLQSNQFDDPVDGYRKYIDVESFIDFMLINELSKNVDGYRISTFLHKQRFSEGNKIVAGPLWDFNLGFGNANYCQGGLTTGWEINFNYVCGGGMDNPFWWNRLLEDPYFANKTHCRWLELRETYLSNEYINNYIDSLATLLESPSQRHYQRWPILSTYVWPNNFIGDTYQEEIDYLKEWIADRLIWMDNNMFGTCNNLDLNQTETSEVNFYPNPSSNNLNIINCLNKHIYITDLNGIIVLNYFSKEQNKLINIEHIPNGLYFLKVAHEIHKIQIQHD